MAEQGIAPNWAWAWPANRRILYNRASADLAGACRGTPANRSSSGNGTRWVGTDVPGLYVPTTKPSDGVGPFIMNAEGVGRLFARDQMAGGAVPSSITSCSIIASAECAAPEDPVEPRGTSVRPMTGRRSGPPSDFPYVATTYRLTEQPHFWTKHALINSILQPE